MILRVKIVNVQICTKFFWFITIDVFLSIMYVCVCVCVCVLWGSTQPLVESKTLATNTVV